MADQGTGSIRVTYKRGDTEAAYILKLIDADVETRGEELMKAKKTTDLHALLNTQARWQEIVAELESPTAPQHRVTASPARKSAGKGEKDQTKTE